MSYVIQLTAVVAPAQPIRIYTKAELNAVKLKCIAIRHYATGTTGAPISKALQVGFNRTLAKFEGGQELVRAASSAESDFDEAQFEMEMASAQTTTQGSYSCAQACQDGSTLCPSGGCILPNDDMAKEPMDLMWWMGCQPKNVSQVTLARSVVSSEFYAPPIFLNGKMLAYKNGMYQPMQNDILVKTMAHLGAKPTLSKAKEIAALVHIAYTEHVEYFDPSPNHICFSNGTLDVGAKCLVPHSPGYQLLNRIEHAYDPTATCPQFMEFLNQIWRDDADREDKIRHMRQWMGYLLTADSSMQKMMILVGNGANGKSVLMDIVKAMVGEKNTANAMLGRLRMPHVRATLESRLLNLSPDLPKAGLVSDGDLKAIVSGDAIEVSPKHIQPYTVHPYVRLMAATNNLPESKDTSDGYFRRMMITSFNRKFSESERNPNLAEALFAEMPGIVAWAVEGLYDLREAGAFSEPASSLLAVDEYKATISPAAMFAKECLVASTTGPGIMPLELFEYFCNWCKERRLAPGNAIAFGRELGQLKFEQRKSRHTWWMVALKDSGLAEPESSADVTVRRPCPPVITEKTLDVATPG